MTETVEEYEEYEEYEEEFVEEVSGCLLSICFCCFQPKYDSNQA